VTPHQGRRSLTANLADLDQSTLNTVTGQEEIYHTYYMDQWQPGTPIYFTLPSPRRPWSQAQRTDWCSIQESSAVLPLASFANFAEVLSGLRDQKLLTAKRARYRKGR